jgi:hypothetical protein
MSLLDVQGLVTFRMDGKAIVTFFVVPKPFGSSTASQLTRILQYA